MRSFILPVTIAAILATAPLALASETATGSIKAFDLKAMTITLDNGTMYTLPKSFKDPGLKTGEKVQLSWDMQNGKHAATDVKVLN